MEDDENTLSSLKSRYTAELKSALLCPRIFYAFMNFDNKKCVKP